MNKRLYREAQAAFERGDYADAYAKAFRLVCDEKSLKPKEVQNLFDMISYGLELSLQSSNDSASSVSVPSNADLIALLEVTSKFPDTAAHTNLLYELAVFAYNRQDYAQAEILMVRAFELIQSDLVEYKSSYLPSIELLVDALCWQSKFDQAVVACDSWLRMAQELLVENDIFTAGIHKKLSDIYSAQGKSNEAEEQLKRCILLHENEDCEHCSDAQTAIKTYVAFLEKQGRATEAAQQRERLQ